MVINQWVPAAHHGDAVGNSALAVRTLLRKRGYQSDLYALSIDEELQGDVHPFSDANARRGDVTILHFAVPSPMSDALTTLPQGRVLQYHNVTPAHFFARHDPAIFRITARGRQELSELAGKVDLALGDSEYNRLELDSLGFEETGVMPIIVNTKRLTEAPRLPALEATLQDGLSNILFVGRIAPNKRIDDHILMAEHYKRYVDTDYRFIFVGRTDIVPRYYATIRALILKLKLRPEQFVFAGAVPDDELSVYYRTARAYVSLSEHEGFCVPLVEAMATRVPIMAYGAGAIPETLGGAGICFNPKDLEHAAELLGLLVYDDTLRNRIITGQTERLHAFGVNAAERAIDKLIARVT